MKTLYLLRHAKSSWDDHTLADYDRPLNDRGCEAAPFMGTLMRDKGTNPALIVSSPALRARTTAELVRQAARWSIDIRFDERIYEASAQALRQVVSELDDSVDSVMIVGHNPGMEGFIQFLTGRSESMPTAAIAVIRMSSDSWSSIDRDCGELEVLYRPKEEKRANRIRAAISK